MGKLLRPQDRILLGLSILGDIFEEIRDPLRIVSASYKNLYGFVPKGYRRSSFEARLRRGFKTGLIEKIIKNEKPYFRLTNQGCKRLIRDFPLLALRKKKWDGKWRVVVFDIPEKERRLRAYLRQKLLELGFGMMQESVWISPLDVAEDLKEYLESRNLGDFVFILVARRLFAGNETKLAEKIWKLREINEEYGKILQEGERIRIVKGKEKESLIKQLKTHYSEILISDPCLPKELLPEDWQGEKARKVIKSLINLA